MSSSRSPRHPSISIIEAIDLTRKIFNSERNNPMSRETAVKHLGYSGINGSSTKAIANIMQYGLMEKSTDAEIRVSGLTFQVLAPESESERVEAVIEASKNPDFFQELNDKYPEISPTEPNLESYLIRHNFTDAALRGASKAYLETRAYVEGLMKEREDINEGASVHLSGEIGEIDPNVSQNDHSNATPPTSVTDLTQTQGKIATLKEDVFTFDEGSVSVRWPSDLSEDSFEDMKDWLELLTRKIGRSIKNR